MSDAMITVEPSKEQLQYAAILEKGMFLGLLLMFVTFPIYIFGIIKSAIPVDEIANYWSQPVHDYLVAINQNFLHLDTLPIGWSWMALIGKSDFLNFIPIVILSGITIICYAVVVPGMFRRGDKAYGIMCIAEVLILSLAASGLLTVGH